MHRHQHRGRNALIALLVVGMLGVGAYLLWQRGIVGSRAVTAEELDRVLIVAASPNEDGDVVGQIIVVVDLSQSPTALEPVSPALAVTIPGTTFSTLADAYPFGGGAGTAEALARAEPGEALPYVAIDADGLAAAVKAAGGVSLTLPAPMSIFDGEELFTFKAEEQTLTAAELQAVFKGAPYLAARERTKLDAELARVLAGLLAAQDGALEETTDTNLDQEAVMALRSALASAARR